MAKFQNNGMISIHEPVLTAICTIATISGVELILFSHCLGIISEIVIAI